MSASLGEETSPSAVNLSGQSPGGPVVVRLVALPESGKGIQPGLSWRTHRGPQHWTFEGVGQAGQAGFALAGGMDLDLNGFPELLLSAPRLHTENHPGGLVLAFDGSTIGLGDEPSWTYQEPNGGTMSGRDLAVGQIGAQSFPAMLVAALSSRKNITATIWTGFASDGPVGSAAWRFVPRLQNASSVGFAGDVNGDGFGDVLVGTPIRSRQDHARCGAAMLFNGTASGVDSQVGWTGWGKSANCCFGRTFAGGGDINGDGLADFVISAPTEDLAGSVSAFYGSPWGPSQATDWKFVSPKAQAQFGESVALGDLNRDGYADLIVGSPGNKTGPSFEGTVQIFAGSATGLADKPCWEVHGERPRNSFGASLDVVGDVDGDGFTDLVVGSPAYANDPQGKATDYGCVYLFLGTSNWPSATPDWVLQEWDYPDSIDAKVCGVGDLNQDCLADFAIGSPRFHTRKGTLPIPSGRVDVFYGSKTSYRSGGKFPVDGINSELAENAAKSTSPPILTNPPPTLASTLPPVTSNPRPSPAFWWWFLLVPLALLGLALWRRNGTRRPDRSEVLAAIEMERQRIASELHDDLGARLTRIAMLTELVKREAAAGGAERGHAEVLTQTMEEVLGSLEQLIWSVDPAKDTLDQFVTFLVQYASSFLAPTAIELTLDLPANVEARPLDALQRKNLFLATKEALANLMKHSGASVAWLRVAIQKDTLQVTVEDNGCGLQTPAPDSGQGLKNMRQRMAASGGTITISPRPAGGTSVCLTIHLK